MALLSEQMAYAIAIHDRYSPSVSMFLFSFAFSSVWRILPVQCGACLGLGVESKKALTRLLAIKSARTRVEWKKKGFVKTEKAVDAYTIMRKEKTT